MPQFTRDFVTERSHNWQKWLGHLKGKPSLGLEIGSYEGRSAIWFCEHILLHPRSQLVCVDPWSIRQEIRHRFEDNTEHLRKAGKVVVYRAHSEPFLKDCQDRFDFIYVDGNHFGRYVISDAVLSWIILNPGGVIIFDDYGHGPESQKEVRIAVDAFLEFYRGRYEVLGRGYQVAIKKKKD